jgi:putative N-acetyltransferase (TIGR04045 family)
MFIDPWPAFRPSEYRVKFATTPWEVAGCKALRHAVFCAEQGLFHGDDSDAVDDVAIPLAALSCLLGMAEAVVGTVRIHQPRPGLWIGSRLAVAQPFRQIGRLGSALIRLAVGAAHGRGCHTFLAQVQVQNVPLFRRLHWQSLEEVTLHGLPHHLMQADLAYYPPCSDPEAGFIAGRAIGP